MSQSLHALIAASYGADDGISDIQRQDLTTLAINLEHKDIFIDWLHCTFPILGDFFYKIGLNVELFIHAAEENGQTKYHASAFKPAEAPSTFVFKWDSDGEFYAETDEKPAVPVGHLTSFMNCILDVAQNCPRYGTDSEPSLTPVSFAHEFNDYTRNPVRRPELNKQLSRIFRKANMAKVQSALDSNKLRIHTAYNLAFGNNLTTQFSLQYQLLRLVRAKVPAFFAPSTIPANLAGEEKFFVDPKCFASAASGHADASSDPHLTLVIRPHKENFDASEIAGLVVDFGGNENEIITRLVGLRTPQ